MVLVPAPSRQAHRVTPEAAGDVCLAHGVGTVSAFHGRLHPRVLRPSCSPVQGHTGPRASRFGLAVAAGKPGLELVPADEAYSASSKTGRCTPKTWISEQSQPCVRIHV